MAYRPNNPRWRQTSLHPGLLTEEVVFVAISASANTEYGGSETTEGRHTRWAYVEWRGGGALSVDDTGFEEPDMGAVVQVQDAEVGGFLPSRDMQIGGSIEASGVALKIARIDTRASANGVAFICHASR